MVLKRAENCKNIWRFQINILSLHPNYHGNVVLGMYFLIKRKL